MNNHDRLGRFRRIVFVCLGFLIVCPSTSQTLTWEQVFKNSENPCLPNGSGPPVLHFAAGHDGYLYFSDPGRLYRSADRGASWQLPNFQLYHIQDIVPLQSDTLLIGLWGTARGVFRLTAHGDVWEATGITDNIFDIAASPDRSLIYTRTASDRLFVSTDRGMTWTDVNPAWDVTAVTVGPDGRTYVRTSIGIYISDDGVSWEIVPYDNFPYPTPKPGYLLSRDTNGVSLSINNGSTWGLVLDVPSASLLTNQEDEIFAISKDGTVFESTDSGETWLQISSGFPDTCSNKSAVTIDAWGHIAAGTSVGVVFRTIESTLTNIEDSFVPERFSIVTNYPNPLKLSTTIAFTLRHPSDIQLEVFDLLGNRVRVLENGFKSSGEHEITFDATGLPSGVYFYTLSAGDFTQTRKMVVLR